LTIVVDAIGRFFQLRILLWRNVSQQAERFHRFVDVLHVFTKLCLVGPAPKYVILVVVHTIADGKVLGNDLSKKLSFATFHFLRQVVA